MSKDYVNSAFKLIDYLKSKQIPIMGFFIFSIIFVIFQIIYFILLLTCSWLKGLSAVVFLAVGTTFFLISLFLSFIISYPLYESYKRREYKQRIKNLNQFEVNFLKKYFGHFQASIYKPKITIYNSDNFDHDLAESLVEKEIIKSPFYWSKMHGKIDYQLEPKAWHMINKLGILKK